jgi:hypothetical protein
MARFAGKIGFGLTVDKGNGKHELEVTERTYLGDVIRNAKRFNEDAKVNDNIVLSNSISIVADPFANTHVAAIRYVNWMGALWKVTRIETQSPRLILELGGVYNGIKAAAPGSP